MAATTTPDVPRAYKGLEEAYLEGYRLERDSVYLRYPSPERLAFQAGWRAGKRAQYAAKTLHPTKDQLTARTRGKGGTMVRIPRDIHRATPIGDVTYRAGVYVVKDLLDRKTMNCPGMIGIGPVDRGIAFGVDLTEIEVVTDGS